jgi:hypothetical protein
VVGAEPARRGVGNTFDQIVEANTITEAGRVSAKLIVTT